MNLKYHNHNRHHNLNRFLITIKIGIRIKTNK